MNTHTAHPNSRLIQFEQTALRAAVWAFVGIVFGFIFVVLSAYLQGVVHPALQLLGASTGAAGLTALFYGSMRLTVMVANFNFIAMVVYSWGNEQLSLEPLIYVGALVGITIGAVYGAKDKQSRVFCAEAKIVAGLLAGLTAAVVGLVPLLLVSGLERAWVAMLVAPAATLIYVSTAGWFVHRCHRFIPPVLDGALVGLGVGSATGLLFMIMAGTLDSGLLDGSYHQLVVERVQSTWGGTVAATALACSCVGILRSLLNVRWYNL